MQFWGKTIGMGVAFACTVTLAACATPPSTSTPDQVQVVASQAADIAVETAPPTHSDRPASAIPWTVVGPGWTVAVWRPQLGIGARSRTVYLVSPTGVRYTISRLTPREQLLAWSAAARLLLVKRETAGAPVYMQTDMTTGRSRTLSLPGSPMAYTSDGRGVFTSTGTNGDLVALDALDSARQDVYPVSEPGVGALRNGPPMQSPDGTTLIFGADRGLAVLNRVGHLFRTLPAPIDGDGCTPLSNWTRGVVLVECDHYDSDAVAHPSMWLMPLSGDSPTRLHVAIGSRTNAPGHFGYTDIWRTSTSEFGISANSCGPGTLVTFDRTGKASPVTVTLPAGVAHGTLAYVGHDGDNITMLDRIGHCNSATTSLIRLNTVTGIVTVLLGPGLNGGTVDEAQPIGQ